MNVNAYRNPIIAEAMKIMKYVNMFNRGVSRVQEFLAENGSYPDKPHHPKQKYRLTDIGKAISAKFQDYLLL